MSEKMTESGTRHVAYDQVRAMLDFMGQHVDFATGSLRSLEARHTSKRLWNELTHILNNRNGVKKSMDGWSKYWSDFKNKLKNKVKLLNKRKSMGGSEKGLRPLTKLEKRALVILGPNFERKICHVTVEGYQEYKEPSTNLPQVKIEDSSMIEEPVIVTDKSPEHHESEEEMESNYDESDHDDEPLIKNIYPNWLINVEKKRAEAELCRARAEEGRVAVASKAAQAALMQAEALRSLANAVSRIAAVLERRPNDLLSI